MFKVDFVTSSADISREKVNQVMTAYKPGPLVQQSIKSKELRGEVPKTGDELLDKFTGTRN